MPCPIIGQLCWLCRAIYTALWFEACVSWSIFFQILQQLKPPQSLGRPSLLTKISS